MTRMMRPTVWAVMAISVSMVASACGGGSKAVVPSEGLTIQGEVVAAPALFSAATKEGTVNVYTSLNEVTNKAIAEAFKKDTGLKIAGIVTPTGRLFERIQSEAGAGVLPADVIQMPDQSLFQTLVKGGMFIPHQVPSDSKIPKEYKSPDHLFYAINSAATVIAYNTKVIAAKDAPKAWADIPKAAAAGNRFGMVHASQGAGGWGLSLFMRKEFGLEYWQKLAATKPVLEASVGALAEKLGRGEVAIAAARTPEVGNLQKQGAPVEYVWPTDGTPMFNFYVAQVAKGKNPNAAKVYMNWILSKRGQTVLAEKGGDFPVHPEAASPILNGKTLPPVADINPYIPSTEDWVGLRDKWITEWNSVFGYRP